MFIDGPITYDRGNGTQTVGQLNVVSKVAGYTAVPSDDVILCNGTFTVTLYTAVGHSGTVIVVKNIGSGTVTVDGNGSETIDGALTFAISTKYESLTIVSDGSNWLLI